MTKLKFLALIPFLLISKTWACSCMQLSLEEHVNTSNNIYYGQLVSATYVKPNTEEEWPFIKGTLTVSETLKGEAKHKISIRTGLGGGDCGIQLVVGKYYAIFIDQDGGYIGSCGASRQVDFHTGHEFLNRVRHVTLQRNVDVFHKKKCLLK